MKFPSDATLKKLKPPVREILQFYKQTIRAEDLIALAKGTLYSENLINCYFKILEKINLVLLMCQKFLK